MNWFLNSCFGNKCIQGRAFGLKCLATERLNMELDGALYILHCFFKSRTLPHNHTLNSSGIGHVTFRMFFDNDFHTSTMPVCAPSSSRIRSTLDGDRGRCRRTGKDEHIFKAESRELKSNQKDDILKSGGASSGSPIIDGRRVTPPSKMGVSISVF